MLETNVYRRKPFAVSAARATSDNLYELAEWCMGTVIEQEGKRSYIQVDALRPLNNRQTKVYPGDWLVVTDSGYKVYLNRAFRMNFVKAKESLTDLGTASTKASESIRQLPEAVSNQADEQGPK